jgi:hypothetical protein
MPAQETIITDHNTASEGDRAMSDISSLTLQVQQLGRSYDSWMLLSQILIGITAVATLLYFGASSMALKRGKELKAASEALDKAKDERVARRQAPRVANVGLLVEALKDKPTGKAEILYLDTDGESADFARWLKYVLTYSNWDVAEPRPIGDAVSGSYSGIPIEEVRKWPAPTRLGAATTGVSIIMNAKTQDAMMRGKEPTPLKTLLSALAAAEVRAGVHKTIRRCLTDSSVLWLRQDEGTQPKLRHYRIFYPFFQYLQIHSEKMYVHALICVSLRDVCGTVFYRDRRFTIHSFYTNQSHRRGPDEKLSTPQTATVSTREAMSYVTRNAGCSVILDRSGWRSQFEPHARLTYRRTVKN